MSYLSIFYESKFNFKKKFKIKLYFNNTKIISWLNFNSNNNNNDFFMLINIPHTYESWDVHKQVIYFYMYDNKSMNENFNVITVLIVIIPIHF